MTKRRSPNSMRRRQPAAEQAAHPLSGPRRRPHALPGSFVTHEDFRRTTHVNCSPMNPARFTIDDLTAPSAPAFMLLDVTPSSIERPDNPRVFAVNLINKLASAKGLPQNYALEVAPYWLASHTKLGFHQYQSPSVGQSIAQSFLISVATVPIPGATASVDPLGTRLGFGFRTFVTNGRPAIALDKKVTELADVDGKILDAIQIQTDAVSSPADKAKAVSDETSLRAKAKALALEVQGMDAERVGLFLAIAGAQSWAFAGDDFSGGMTEKGGFWVTPSYRFKSCDATNVTCKVSSVDVIGVARALMEKNKEARYDVGGRLVVRATSTTLSDPE